MSWGQGPRIFLAFCYSPHCKTMSFRSFIQPQIPSASLALEGAWRKELINSLIKRLTCHRADACREANGVPEDRGVPGKVLPGTELP